jgi:hypothetical protein
MHGISDLFPGSDVGSGVDAGKMVVGTDVRIYPKTFRDKECAWDRSTLSVVVFDKQEGVAVCILSESCQGSKGDAVLECDVPDF